MLVIFFVDLIEIDINKPVYKTVHYQQSLTLNLVRPGTGGECKYANIKLRVLSQVLVNSWLTPGKVYKTSREDPER